VHNHVKVVRNVEKEQEEELKKLIGEELWEKLEGKNEDSRS